MYARVPKGMSYFFSSQKAPTAGMNLELTNKNSHRIDAFSLSITMLMDWNSLTVLVLMMN